MSTAAGWAAALLSTLCLVSASPSARAHGGVMLDDDLCVIKVGYLDAHFKIYLPRQYGHREFCEDLPAAGETVFVMEYLHRGFSDAPIDFRIVRNVTGLGEFTRWADVEAIGDLDAITVFHQPAALAPDVFTTMVNLDTPGDYVGIVTARHPDAGKTYQAVFPFAVGFTGLGIWPWLALFVAYLLGNIWFLLRRRPAAARLGAGRPGSADEPSPLSSSG